MEGENGQAVDGEAPVKSAKQLKKEAEKAAKLEKFKAKEEKMKATAPKATEKPKKEEMKPQKPKAEVKIPQMPPGEKKDVTEPLPDAYEPAYVEAVWYPWWEKQGFFTAEYNSQKRGTAKDKENFVMVIPPPNVTGSLHLGHALTNSVEDAITRYHRMKGKTTLWVPGCDHAGIATQVVVEKKLWREEKLSRHDLGRDEFVKRIWKWKEEKGHRIYEQIKKMGSSPDWSRASFTMDPKLCTAVTEAFVRMHQDGTIYRSTRLVNWSCTLKSAISDIEVEKVELSGRKLLTVPGHSEPVEFGVLTSFAYRVADGEEEEIVVSTTRPETMLGDTAVAVHPADARYAHLVGRSVVHPFCSRMLPIVADDFVDVNFGTGAVKITPAHDANDYDVAKRQNLPMISILDDDGTIVGDCQQFVGMKRFDARRAVLQQLKELGLYRGTADNPMVVPVCSRSKDIVEPMIKPQWYVKCDRMAADAIDAVKTKRLKIIPDAHEKTWFHWMENMRDWCISRQLWWGHRIPAYLVTVEGEPKGDGADDRNWVSGRTPEEARRNAADRFQVDEARVHLEQDEDVLDTWFSSALFPFSVFGWPDRTDDLAAFYPTTLLETGHDILFFWVARMVFFGQKLTGMLPFKEVYLHAMVRDAHGRKMSKSLGNVIDPLDVIYGITLEDLHKTLDNSNLDPNEIAKAREGQKSDYKDGIPECGTDALRFALCAYTSQGRDINLDVLRVQGYRHFCNKLWNAARFSLTYLQGSAIRPLPSSQASSGAGGSAADEQRTFIASPDVLCRLNAHLEHASYLGGGFQVSCDDRRLFSRLQQSLAARDVPARYPHLARWYRHIGALPVPVPAAADGSGRGRKRAQVGFGFVDRWILSRLACAVGECNAAFETYDLPKATTALFEFWLYEVCDVYLELIKPVFWKAAEAPQGSPAAEAAAAARTVLSTCLDVGLRLISPFMPFISEELWQRLPLRINSAEIVAPSVCVADYPSAEEWIGWRSADVEERMKLVEKVYKEIRSTRSTYNLPNKTRTKLVIYSPDPQAHEILHDAIDAIATLSYCDPVTIQCQARPSTDSALGCAVVPLPDHAEALIHLQGLIDFAKEKERISKRHMNLDQLLTKLRESMMVDQYEVRVPFPVREENREKLAKYELEMSQLRTALSTLSTD